MGTAAGWTVAMAKKTHPLSAEDLARLRRHYALACQFPEAIRRDFAALGDEIDRLQAEVKDLQARKDPPKEWHSIDLASWGLGALS